MSIWIVTQKEHEVFDSKNNSLGMCPKMALFYLKSIGKRRNYRRPLSETDTDFQLQTYKTEEEAKSEADYCNEIHGDNYEPELLAD